MQWSEEGCVLSLRRHGEANTLLEIFTSQHGRHLGLVRGGRSQRMRSQLQPGNRLIVTWRARLPEHLGTFTIEPVKLRAAVLMDNPLRLAALSSLCALAGLIAEHEPHENLYEAFEIVIDALENDDVWPALMIRWELGLLEELGFGLDLKSCAATGTTDNLIYVSPKSGRAVSAEAGLPYKNKLLVLPAFLRNQIQVEELTPVDIVEGFRLTGYFLQQHIYNPRRTKFPEPRERLQTKFQAAVV
jgi:DNA repair protein RecO (recombination protein O)